MLFLAWLLTPALAAPIGHYHPIDVATASVRFGEAQNVAGKAFEAAQGSARALASGLIRYETALDLLGEAAPTEQRERHQALDHQFRADQAVVSAFAQQQADGFDAAFSAALERALAGRDVLTCKAPEERGLRMSQRPSRSDAEPCEGPALNEELAATMDADPALKAQLDALLGQTWPTFTVDHTPMPAVGGDVWIDTYTVLHTAAPDALDAIATADDDARLNFQAAIEQGASLEERQALVVQARQVTARTASQRAEVAAPVIAAIDARAAKATKKGAPPLGWCAQPEVFGGCAGEPAPPALDNVVEHPKVLKAMAAANAWRP